MICVQQHQQITAGIIDMNSNKAIPELFLTNI